jgi:hypothetical protein
VAEALHVANGHCTTRLIEQARLPGRTSIWAEALPPHDAKSASWGPRLHEGPIADVDDAELVRMRAAEIADGLGGRVEDIEADLKSWRAAVDADHEYDELVLWFEHDLFDQLNLIQLLARIGRDRPVRKPVSLVSIDAYPGRQAFKGLGELGPDDIAKLFTQRRRVTREQFAVAARAWDAFRSQHRRRLEELLHEDLSALPFLARALRRYLDEAPAEPGGLTRSERRLLDQLARGPVDIHTAWKRMHDGETAFYITDSSFWGLLKGLARRTPALIDITLSADTSGPLPHGQLSLRS